MIGNLQSVFSQIKSDLSVISNIVYEGAFFNQSPTSGDGFEVPYFAINETQGKILFEVMVTGSTYDQGGYATFGSILNARFDSTNITPFYGSFLNDGHTRFRMQAALGTNASANESAAKGGLIDTTTYANYCYGMQKVIVGYNTPINRIRLYVSGLSYYSVAYFRLTKIA